MKKPIQSKNRRVPTLQFMKKTKGGKSQWKIMFKDEEQYRIWCEKLKAEDKLPSHRKLKDIGTGHIYVYF